MMTAVAIYNPRKSNGDVNNITCDNCSKIGSAYIKIDDEINFNACRLICKSCLVEWDQLINKSILQDVTDSVRRRRIKNV